MSLADIAVNGRTYSVASVNGTDVVRKCTSATLPAGLSQSVLEISHTVGKGNKPDRHLLRFTDSVIDSTTGAQRDYQVYCVIQVPKGGSATERADIISEADPTSGNLVAQIQTQLAVSGFGTRLINGEFS